MYPPGYTLISSNAEYVEAEDELDLVLTTAASATNRKADGSGGAGLVHAMDGVMPTPTPGVLQGAGGLRCRWSDPGDGGLVSGGHDGPIDLVGVSPKTGALSRGKDVSRALAGSAGSAPPAAREPKLASLSSSSAAPLGVSDVDLSTVPTAEAVWEQQRAVAAAAGISGDGNAPGSSSSDSSARSATKDEDELASVAGSTAPGHGEASGDAVAAAGSVPPSGVLRAGAIPRIEHTGPVSFTTPFQRVPLVHVLPPMLLRGGVATGERSWSGEPVSDTDGVLVMAQRVPVPSPGQRPVPFVSIVAVPTLLRQPRIAGLLLSAHNSLRCLPFVPPAQGTVTASATIQGDSAPNEAADAAFAAFQARFSAFSTGLLAPDPNQPGASALEKALEGARAVRAGAKSLQLKCEVTLADREKAKARAAAAAGGHTGGPAGRGPVAGTGGPYGARRPAPVGKRGPVAPAEPFRPAKRQRPPPQTVSAAAAGGGGGGTDMPPPPARQRAPSIMQGNATSSGPAALNGDVPKPAVSGAAARLPDGASEPTSAPALAAPTSSSETAQA